MNREFLDFYNAELALLKEEATAFAEEYPGVAERLGGISRNRTDPAIGGLLEGAAFLAARVQLKLAHEFPEFTGALADLLLPSFLAPTPSVLMAAVRPRFEDPGLLKGIAIPAGTALDATYRERERRIACRYRLVEPITLLPLTVADARYEVGPGPLAARGVPVAEGTAASLTLTLALDHPEVEAREDGRPGKGPGLSAVEADAFPLYLSGPFADMAALVEQLFARLLAIHVRTVDAFGDPVVFCVPRDQLEQLGFDDGAGLLGEDPRLFSGFQLLRDYFVFPERFLGFRLTGLRRILGRIAAARAEIAFSFCEAVPRLAAAVGPRAFRPCAAPVVNLFEKRLDRIALSAGAHEFQVMADRSNPLAFEPHRIVSVRAHFPGGGASAPVRPLYAPLPEGTDPARSLHYAVRRVPRRRSAQERRAGAVSDYVGTDLFLSFHEPARLGGDAVPAAELSVTALCSNRHLTEHLPVGEGGADFRLVDDLSLEVECFAGPTPPREPVVGHRARGADGGAAGTVAWRLVRALSVNHLGFSGRSPEENAEGLRDVLSLFADLSGLATRRAIAGVKRLEARPVVRRIRGRTGAAAGRGLEVTVTFDEKAFEGTGVFLLGAVIDRFLAEAVAINSFVQTVIVAEGRGVLARFPPRTGARQLL